MAVVSKIDRHGVDNAIEALQQSLFPRLIAYWDSSAIYTSYPRANKNFKKDDIIPEISLDKKEYKEVLTDDKVSVNSFWLVNNARPYDADNKQLIHDVSLIFQADLVKLYGQTNRADEEFNIDVLRELTRKNVFMFNEDITVITTIDAVYSDLTFSPEMKEKIIYTDISNLHVVRFDFEIRYNIDCIPTLAPICTGASETLNSVPISPLANATTKNIIVQNDLPSPVQVGTALVDTPTSLIVSVPAGTSFTPVLDFLPMKTGAGDLGSFATGDDGSTDLGSGSDFFTLESNNPFGNLFVFTGNTGGYWDHNTSQWKDMDGVVTTEALAIPDDIVLNWATYTGGSRVLGMYRVPRPIQNQAAHNTGNPYTLVGFADWQIFNDNVGEKYIYRGIFRNPFNYPPISHDMVLSSDQIWSSYKDNSGGGWKWSPTTFGVVAASITARSFVYRMFVLTTDLGL